MRLFNGAIIAGALLFGLTACGIGNEASSTEKLEAHSTVYQLANQSELLLGSVRQSNVSLQDYEEVVQGMKALLEAPPASDQAYIDRAEELMKDERAHRPSVLLAYADEKRGRILEQGYGEECTSLLDELPDKGLEPRFFYRHVEAVEDCFLTAVAQHAARSIN